MLAPPDDLSVCDATHADGEIEVEVSAKKHRHQQASRVVTGTHLIRPATAADENFAFTAEIAYFEEDPNKSTEQMATAWAGADSWPRRTFRECVADGRAWVAVVVANDDGRGSGNGDPRFITKRRRHNDEEGDNSGDRVGFLRWDRCSGGGCACGGAAACVGNIYVARHARRRGLAQRLFAAFDVQAAARGFTASCLTVEAWNVGARDLYARLGYVQPRPPSAFTDESIGAPADGGVAIGDGAAGGAGTTARSWVVVDGGTSLIREFGT